MEWLNVHPTWHIFFPWGKGGGCVDFVLQQECITNTCNTCKSELMFDFDLALYNLATYHLALVFHITCV